MADENRQRYTVRARSGSRWVVRAEGWRAARYRVDWFNRERLLGPIGNIPPAWAEAARYRQQVALSMAA